MQALDVTTLRELEDLIIDAIYRKLVVGKMDQKNRQFTIGMVACIPPPPLVSFSFSSSPSPFLLELWVGACTLRHAMQGAHSCKVARCGTQHADQLFLFSLSISISLSLFLGAVHADSLDKVIGRDLKPGDLEKMTKLFVDW